MLVKIKRGLDLPIAAAAPGPAQQAPAVSSVALVGPDYMDLKPSLAVAEGERVRLGDILFTHRKHPELCFTAPGSGTILAINRGARRRLLSVVIKLEGDDAVHFPAYPSDALDKLASNIIKESLLASGLWTAFRARPYNRIPVPDASPRSIFVTAIDTNPGAANPVAVIAEQAEAFCSGLRVINRLVTDKTYLCKARSADVPSVDMDSLVTVEFQGPHPAGLPGTHMHYLAPVTDQADLWHIGCQDVIAIGKLFRTGRLWTERIVAVGGPGIKNPRLVRTRSGANLDELLNGEQLNNCRVISGSVLSGRQATRQTAHLGRYHQQISVLPEVDYPDLAAPRAGQHRAMTTAIHGWPSGMLTVEAFDRVWPLHIPAIPLLRALLIKDTDTAVALGCLGLDEEDLALCSYVCPAKYDYGSALRATLNEIERAG